MDKLDHLLTPFAQKLGLTTIAFPKPLHKISSQIGLKPSSIILLLLGFVVLLLLLGCCGGFISNLVGFIYPAFRYYIPPPPPPPPRSPPPPHLLLLLLNISK